MKTILKSVLLLSILAQLISGCKDSSYYKPNISGSMGEVLVIMDNKWSKTQTGESLLRILKQPMDGLPQVEPIFNVIVAPHHAFSESFHTFRNLIITNIGPEIETEGVRFFSKTSWARGQIMVEFNAKTPETFLQLIKDNEIKLIGFILRTERQRNMNYQRQLVDTDLRDEIINRWRLADITIPNTYTKNKSSKDFSWLSIETPTSSQGLILYEFDYLGEETLSKEFLLHKRDSLLKINIPGPSDGSYMSTEHNLPITYKKFSIDNHEVVELRGLWKVIGDMMGGPFVMFAHYDKDAQRVVVTDGYVYLPNEPKKRNLVWQTESILYSVKFHNTEQKEDI